MKINETLWITGVETIDDNQQYRIDNIPNRKAQVLYHQPMRLFSADPFHDEHKSREKETFLPGYSGVLAALAYLFDDLVPGLYLYTPRGKPGREMEELPEYPCYFLGKWVLARG